MKNGKASKTLEGRDVLKEKIQANSQENEIIAYNHSSEF